MSEGEREAGEGKRLAHAIERIRALLTAVESSAAVRAEGPADAEAIAHAGVDIAAIISRRWAYRLAEGA